MCTWYPAHLPRLSPHCVSAASRAEWWAPCLPWSPPRPRSSSSPAAPSRRGSRSAGGPPSASGPPSAPRTAAGPSPGPSRSRPHCRQPPSRRILGCLERRREWNVHRDTNLPWLLGGGASEYSYVRLVRVLMFVSVSLFVCVCVPVFITWSGPACRSGVLPPEPSGRKWVSQSLFKADSTRMYEVWQASYRAKQISWTETASLWGVWHSVEHSRKRQSPPHHTTHTSPGLFTLCRKQSFPKRSGLHFASVQFQKTTAFGAGSSVLFVSSGEEKRRRDRCWY